MPGQWCSNNYCYKPQLTTQGTTDHNAFSQAMDNVDTRLGQLDTWQGQIVSWKNQVDGHIGRHVTLGDPGYSTLSEALTTIGSNNRTLVVPAGTVNITGNTTIPANVHLVVLRGGVFNISNGVTLTINGPLTAEPYQIFSGSGTATLGFGSPTARQVFPDWWYSGTGSWHTALAATMAAVKNAGGGTICLTRDIAITSQYVHDIYYASFDGGGYTIDASGMSSGEAIRISSTNTIQYAYARNVRRFVGNFYLVGNSKTGNVVGILFQGTSSNASAAEIMLRNVNISTFGTGIKTYSYSWELEFYKVNINNCTIGLDVPTGGTQYAAKISTYGGCWSGLTTAIRNYVGTCVINCLGTSFDWIAKLCDLNGGKLFLTNCYCENIGAEAGGATEAIKVDGYGASFSMIGGTYLGGESGNTQYLVNLVVVTNIAIFKDVFLYGVAPSSGALATGAGLLVWEPLTGLLTTDNIGMRWASVTNSDLADGGFENSSGGLKDDWYIIRGGTYSSRWSYSNLTLAASTDYARTGSYSLKANKVAAGNATFAVAIPVKRRGQMASWEAYYRKPGNGTGTMYISAYWTRFAGFDLNGVYLSGQEQLIGSDSVNFTSTPVNWTATNSVYKNMWGDAKAPDWATHFTLIFNLDGLTGGQAYYFDDIRIFLN